MIVKVALGSDHAGYYLKEELGEFLKELGCEVINIGSFDPDSCDDYPDYAFQVGQMVSSKQADVGVLVCGTGIGVSIAANKVKGIRAAVCHDVSSARLAKKHNDANIICFGARLIGTQTAKDATEEFLNAKFEQGRHKRRIDKIEAKEGGSLG